MVSSGPEWPADSAHSSLTVPIGSQCLRVNAALRTRLVHCLHTNGSVSILTKNPGKTERPKILLHAGPPGTGRLTMLVSLPENAALAQDHGRAGVTGHVEISDKLTPSGWSAVAVKTPGASWTGSVTTGPASGGLVPVTVRAPDTIASGQWSFLRLRVEWNP